MKQHNAPDLRQETLIRKEWLLPNGRGGFASSTFSGINTRKYHGLLISGFDDKGARSLYVSALEEKIIIGDHRFFFSAHKYYADAIYPRGFVHLMDYGQAPGLVWFKFGNFQDYDLSVLKVIRVKKGQEAVEIEYFFQGTVKDAVFAVYPLVTARNVHQVTTQAPYHSERGDEWNGTLPFSFERVGPSVDGWHGIAMKNKINSRTCLIRSSASEYTDKQDWYHSFQYDREMERGYEYVEDLYCPGKFVIGGDQLKKPLRLIFSLSEGQGTNESAVPAFEGSRLESQEVFRSITSREPVSPDIVTRWKEKLTAQADDFWVENPAGNTGIIAGYPWFGVWSRDMLQSMEGLLLSLGQHARAKEMLLSLALQTRGGLVPNILEESEKRYEFLGDSSLWFMVAVFQYMKATSDRSTLESLWPAVQDVIARYLHDSGEHPIMGDDGLIVLSHDGSKAATWMDAVIGGQAITPRYGKPVEIQALWYNALCMLDYLSGAYQLSYPLAADAITGRGFSDLKTLSSRVKRSFISQFVHPESGSLADVIKDDAANWQVRPNQLFAAGLPFPLLSKPQTKNMLAVVQSELMTPWGLRTLSPKDPQYKGYYGGAQVERDRAYHQGTVWPWLLGMYIRSVRFAEGPKGSEACVQRVLTAFFSHLESLGIEYIPEIFSADDGHPDGAFHQAWSIAEILGIISDEKIATVKKKQQPKRRKSA